MIEAQCGYLKFSGIPIDTSRRCFEKSRVSKLRREFARTTRLRILRGSFKGQMGMFQRFRETHFEQRSVGEARIGDAMNAV